MMECIEGCQPYLKAAEGADEPDPPSSKVRTGGIGWVPSAVTHMLHPPPTTRMTEKDVTAVPVCQVTTCNFIESPIHAKREGGMKGVGRRRGEYELTPYGC